MVGDRRRLLGREAVDAVQQAQALRGDLLLEVPAVAVAVQRATVEDLMAVERVDRELAVSIKDTLERVTESTILDQYS